MEQIRAKKIGMSQIFNDKVRLVPVTIVQVVGSEQVSLEVGEYVSVRGISKGKGFQGVVKRFNAGGDKASHGRKHSARRVGSIGSSFPEKVFKGKHMPGRMGSKNVTIKNLSVERIDEKNKLVALRGALPGARNSFVTLQRSTS